MNINTILQYGLALIISVLRPMLFKNYKEYMTTTLLLSTIAMLIFSISSFLYKYNTGVIDKDELKNKLKKGITPEKLVVSFLSYFRFSFKFVCISALPLSISIPIAKLDIIFTELFNYFINGNPITINMIISTLFLLFGLFVLNYDKIANNKGKDKYNKIYIIGLIFSTIFAGFINVYYSNYDKEKGDENGYKVEPDDVIYSESAGALITALIVSYYYISNKKEKIPSIKNIGIILILCLIIFNTSVYLKWKLLKSEPLIRNQLIMNMSIPLSFIVGILYYKENFNMKKFIGIIIIITSIIYYSTSKNIS